MKSTIYFENAEQVMLWNSEFLGQFSDGYWENSRRMNWQFWNECDVKINPDCVGVTNHPTFFAGKEVNRGIQLGNKMLLDIVGGRMKVYVAMARLYPEIAKKMNYDGYSVPTEMIDYVRVVKSTSSSPAYLQNKKALYKKYGITMKVVKDIVNAANEMTMTDLRKICRRMAAILKIDSEGE